MEDEILILEITDLSRGGAGVARQTDGASAGRVVFVPFTAPGDRIRARVLDQEKHFAQGECLEILTASPIRQKPRCDVFGKCGGCEWQHLPYDFQWKTKLNGVCHALERSQVKFPKFDEIPASNPWNYRNRIQLRTQDGGVGFYAAGSHQVVPVKTCDIARTELNSKLDHIRKEGRDRPPAKVELEIFSDGKVVDTWNSKHAARGFRQVNDDQNLKLLEWITRHLTAGPDRVLLDLYGGNGNFSRPLVDRFKETFCVDISAPHKNISIPNLYFVKSGVPQWLVSRGTSKMSPASAILDPPRIGLSGDFTVIAERLEGLGVSEIIAVGCDVDSWVRDISRWVKRGWKFENSAVIDLFPQTSHAECLGRLVL